MNHEFVKLITNVGFNLYADKKIRSFDHLPSFTQKVYSGFDNSFGEEINFRYINICTDEVTTIKYEPIGKVIIDKTVETTLIPFLSKNKLKNSVEIIGYSLFPISQKDYEGDGYKEFLKVHKEFIELMQMLKCREQVFLQRF